MRSLYDTITDTLCQLGRLQRGRESGPWLFACDTHSNGYPTNPNHNMDITLSTQQKPPKGCKVSVLDITLWPPW